MVAAVGDHEATAKLLRGGLQASGRSARTFSADLLDVAQIGPLYERIAADLGQIDILVNNAAMGRPIPAIDVTVEDWDTMMDLNRRAHSSVRRPRLATYFLVAMGMVDGGWTIV